MKTMLIKGDKFSGHVCSYCCAANVRSKENPLRTDFCEVCGHRGSGVQRKLAVGDWLRVAVR